MCHSNDIKRFKSKIRRRKGCWLWTGALHRDGYAKFWFDGGTVRAHRWYYQIIHGKISDSLVLDHKCRNRNCVNPECLEPVTVRENTVRGLQARKPHLYEEN